MTLGEVSLQLHDRYLNGTSLSFWLLDAKMLRLSMNTAKTARRHSTGSSSGQRHDNEHANKWSVSKVSKVHPNPVEKKARAKQ